MSIESKPSPSPNSGASGSMSEGCISRLSVVIIRLESASSCSVREFSSVIAAQTKWGGKAERTRLNEWTSGYFQYLTGARPMKVRYHESPARKGSGRRRKRQDRFGTPETPVLMGRSQELAEGVGFEPTLRFPVNTLSKRAPSTARPPLRQGARSLAKRRGACNRSARFRRAQATSESASGNVSGAVSTGSVL